MVILSGDRDEFTAVEFAGKTSTNAITEFSTGPLSGSYIPFWRTFRRKTSEFIERKIVTILEAGEGEEEEVVTSGVKIPTEKMLKYIIFGNYKW